MCFNVLVGSFKWIWNHNFYFYRSFSPQVLSQPFLLWWCLLVNCSENVGSLTCHHWTYHSFRVWKTAEVGIEPPKGWQATVRTSAFKDFLWLASAKHMTISGTKWPANEQQAEGGSHQADKLLEIRLVASKSCHFLSDPWKTWSKD